MKMLLICCVWVGLSARTTKDRQDGRGPGLDGCLPGSGSLQSWHCAPPCEDGLPCERRGPSREEGQPGTDQG